MTKDLLVQHREMTCSVQFVQTLPGTRKSAHPAPQQVFKVFRSSRSFSEAVERDDRYTKLNWDKRNPDVPQSLFAARLEIIFLP